MLTGGNYVFIGDNGGLTTIDGFNVSSSYIMSDKSPLDLTTFPKLTSDVMLVLETVFCHSQQI